MFGRKRPQPEAAPVHDVAGEDVRGEDLAGEAPAGPSAVVRITDATFLEQTEGTFTVVDFWAAWCAPCRSFAPVFAAVAAVHDGPVRFGSCDVDANPQTAALLQIRSIPTLVVFGPDGSEVGRSTGAVRRGDLEATVAQLARRAG